MKVCEEELWCEVEQLLTSFAYPFSAWLFGLDSAPLLLSIGVYIFAWPSAFVELKMSFTAKPRSVPWEMGSKSSQLQWNDDAFFNSRDPDQGFTMQQTDQEEWKNLTQ